MIKEEIKVEGMMCNHCSASVTGALTALNGVESVDVSLENKNVTVAYDESKVSRETMIDVICDLGFDAE